MAITLFDTVQKRKEEIKGKIRSAKVSTKQVDKGKYMVRMSRKRAQYTMKNLIDQKVIEEVLNSIEKGQELKLISNKFDAPSLIFSIQELYGIKELYVSTWAITDRGVDSLRFLADKGIHSFVVLDKTYSYKWIFQSGVYKMLSEYVHFNFCENHSKVILMETECGKKISFSGSMNLSHNPRIENIDISFDSGVFEFYKSFIMGNFDGI